MVLNLEALCKVVGDGCLEQLDKLHPGSSSGVVGVASSVPEHLEGSQSLARQLGHNHPDTIRDWGVPLLWKWSLREARKTSVRIAFSCSLREIVG
eukprot:2979054-Rhodomonas_salina.1